MALINCKECGHQVSDKAKFCVNCGYPLEEEKTQSTTEELPEYLKSAIRKGADIDAVYNAYFGFNDRKDFEEKEEKVSEIDQWIRDYKEANPFTWPYKLQKMLD